MCFGFFFFRVLCSFAVDSRLSLLTDTWDCTSQASKGTMQYLSVSTAAQFLWLWRYLRSHRRCRAFFLMASFLSFYEKKTEREKYLYRGLRLIFSPSFFIEDNDPLCLEIPMSRLQWMFSNKRVLTPFGDALTGQTYTKIKENPRSKFMSRCLRWFIVTVVTTKNKVALFAEHSKPSDR